MDRSGRMVWGWFKDFPGGSDSKDSACNMGGLGTIPGLGRSPRGGHGNPLMYSCLENSMDKAAWQAAVHGITKVGHEWALTPTTFKFKALNISTVFNLSVNQGEEKGISLKDLFTWINLSLTCGKSGQVMLNTLGPKSVVPAVDSSLPQSGSVSRVCWVSVSHVIRIPLSSDTVW